MPQLAIRARSLPRNRSTAYEVKDPQLNGGGPRYVIDPKTGAILAKRYEQ